MLTATTKRDVDALQDNAMNSAHEAGRKTREFIDTTTQNARSTIAATERNIREHPVRSSAIAAGVGFVIGLLMRRS